MNEITDIEVYKAQLALDELDEQLRDRLRTVCDVTVRAIDKGLSTDAVIKTFQLSMKLYFP